MRKFNKWIKRVLLIEIGVLIGILAMGFMTPTDADYSQKTNTIIIEQPSSPEPTSTPVPTSTPKVTHSPELGKIRCKITAYCIENYPHICNNGDSSTTATGTKPTPGRTVAVDPRVIPYFSNVIIDGHTYIAEDCGGAVKGNRVDIVFATHQEALDFGVQYADVYWVK